MIHAPEPVLESCGLLRSVNHELSGCDCFKTILEKASALAMNNFV